MLKTVEKVTVAKFKLAFAPCQNNLKTLENLKVINLLQGFDGKEIYLHLRNRSVSFQKRQKMLRFHHFRLFSQCCYPNVPVRVPFSKSTAFKFCGQKMYRFRLNRRPIPGGCTTYIMGTGTCHREGYRFSRYWYKERYQFSQFWYEERYRFSRFWYEV